MKQNPNEKKEVLNSLIESQFSKGFLELNFDDDDVQDSKPQSKKPASNPVTNPGNKKSGQDIEFEFDQSKSVKHPKNKQRKSI